MKTKKKTSRKTKRIEQTLKPGDCVKVAPKLGKFDLVFADPPFNIGQPYNDYRDNLPDDEFIWWSHEWIKVAWKATSGVLALHGPDHLVPIYLAAAERLKMNRIAWILWHFRFGQNNSRKTKSDGSQSKGGNWTGNHCHCLFFARPSFVKKHGKLKNTDEVKVKSDRAAVYKDRRTNPEADEFEGGGMRLPGTVWGVPSDGPFWGRVQGNNKERVDGCPNQLPERYLERIIRAYTSPLDRVLDMFAGSGTTLVVSKALERHSVGIEKSRKTCQLIKSRIKRGAVRV